MPLRTVTVTLSHCQYDIDIGEGLLRECGNRLSKLDRVSHVVIITDENVAGDYAETARESLSQSGINVDVIPIAPGEKSKSIDVTTHLWSQLLDLGADRRSVVVAVGGGVVGDLAGFVAASFARGIRFVQVPTTLLAQVDSSVGGKVGINLPGAKNMVGAFWQPELVLVDVTTLASLPEREYRAGLAEVVKYGVILDADFFEYLESHVAEINRRDPQVLITIGARCCRLKADVVEADEREVTGRRAVLNYGHTFAHAFEAAAGYGELLHGEAVSIGMLCASRLAVSLGMIDSDVTDRQRRLLEQLGLPRDLPDYSSDQLLDIMQRDKKVEHGRLRFVLPSRLGEVRLVGDVDARLVSDALRE